MSDIMARITEILQALGNTGWEWLAYLALALGILFTVVFRVTQLRRFPTMIRLSSTGGTMGKDGEGIIDRKSTRLNSSHVAISYAVFCLKKKKSSVTSPAGHCDRGTYGRICSKQ